jgi:hypothetical protein
MKKLIVATLLFFGVQMAAQTDIPDSQRRSLAGIAGLGLDIENLPPAAEGIGLTKAVIQTDVELKLRLAGINGMPPPHYWALSVKVTMPNSGRGAMIEIKLVQPVVLEWNPSIKGLAATWWDGGIVVNPSANGVRDMVKDIVDTFLNDWLTVNPKSK